jgi:hypothetical protein
MGRHETERFPGVPHDKRRGFPAHIALKNPLFPICIWSKGPITGKIIFVPF